MFFWPAILNKTQVKSKIYVSPKNSPKNQLKQTQHPQNIAKKYITFLPTNPTIQTQSRLLTPCCSFVTFAIRMVLGIPCFTSRSRISRVWQLLERFLGPDKNHKGNTALILGWTHGSDRFTILSKLGCFTYLGDETNLLI